ncbi:uncharacterized protein LOC132601672 [Lycium barbarum]|uniref:uncharacterized protein LOC132601672 n=1 Tax=Lycium barbarum TaxID=112863 RepID=UPI00293EB7B8|nr:uncharacterized protein LOC132601672 [Lycium barbarum]
METSTDIVISCGIIQSLSILSNDSPLKRVNVIVARKMVAAVSSSNEGKENILCNMEDLEESVDPKLEQVNIEAGVSPKSKCKSMKKGKKAMIQQMKEALSVWSKEAFSDIFRQLIIMEDIVRIKEQLFEEEPTVENRTVLQLCALPKFEEVKRAVFELRGDNVCGPDGLSGTFYHACWDIIGVDVFMLVKAFYEGHTLPKSITHTNLVLLPKKPLVQSFADLRPISLSNFINKVISRVLHARLYSILPQLISINQSGFVKRRSIIENVLLTQELVTDIRKKGRSTNVIIKLDMAKAYDLTKVMEKWALQENLWIRFGDCWPTIAVEVLSRSVNSLFEDEQYRSYGMPKWSANLNRLAHSDDTVIFTSTDKVSLEMIMSILKEYEKVSGQLINRDKSSFYMHQNTTASLFQEVENITGFSRAHEGGLGFRSLFDMSKALFTKLWWRFRTGGTIWATYMWNKYCKRKIPTLVQWNGGSQLWKNMLEARDAIEHEYGGNQ